MSHATTPEHDDTDEGSYLSYFSSFNKQSFETTEQPAEHQTDAITDGEPLTELKDRDRVPHPPMRSTITPINIALPTPGDVQFQQQVMQRAGRSDGQRTRGKRGGQNTSPKNVTPNQYALSNGPIASLVTQHNHTLNTQLRNVQSQTTPMPTIVLQPVLMNLTQEQQVVAAQLQERFFSIVSTAGQNGQGPLAIVAPNVTAFTGATQQSPQHSPPATMTSPCSNGGQHGLAHGIPTSYATAAQPMYGTGAMYAPGAQFSIQLPTHR